MKNIVLKNKNNEVVRVFHCHTAEFCLFYRKKTGRLDLASRTCFSEKEKQEIQILQELTVNKLAQNKMTVFTDHYLEMVDEVVNGPVPFPQITSKINSRDFWFSAGSVCGLFLVFSTGFLLYSNVESEEDEEKVEQRVVKIIKPPPIINPEKVIVGSNSSYIRDSKIKSPKKIVKKVLKRMGVLAALGSLSKDQTNQPGGLNLGASAVSSGPGLRALSASSGSGGVQNAIYSKGMITTALGSGGNIKGGGGYGTKGRASGGGKAGYGKLTLVGSGGTEDLSETTTMNLQGGGFDFGLIERKILLRSGEIRNCYDRSLKFNTKLKGVFVSQFLIGLKGQVVSSKIHKTSKIKDKGISECILSVIDKIKFDINLNQQGLLNIVFPFDLEALGT